MNSTSHAVQYFVKVNTMQELLFRLHCGMQFERDALISPMLYTYFNSEILIIDLPIIFVSYTETCLLIPRKYALELVFKVPMK